MPHKLNGPLKEISGSTLKIIAMVTMVIDHIGLAIWYRLPELGYIDAGAHDIWYIIYRCMRNIGRSAFPIFCFLLVEGFFHTSSKVKYAGRLVIFALLSELPFRYAFLGLTSDRNVFFTLFVGLVTIWGMELAKQLSGGRRFLISFVQILTLISGTYLADVLHTDYGGKGVLLIGIFYLLHELRFLACLLGYLSFLWEPFCLPAFFLIWCYNGKRGIGLKYLFYSIYPVHLALFYVMWRYLL